MISLKKGLFALSFGIGMAISLNAWAYPDCNTCDYWAYQCGIGNASACTSYIHFGCEGYCG